LKEKDIVPTRRLQPIEDDPTETATEAGNCNRSRRSIHTKKNLTKTELLNKLMKR
jgi:hypothetical protein